MSVSSDNSLSVVFLLIENLILGCGIQIYSEGRRKKWKKNYMSDQKKICFVGENDPNLPLDMSAVVWSRRQN